MSALAILHIACNISFALLGLAAAMILVRLVAGPTLADRILCLDALTMVAAGGICVFSIEAATYAYLDLSIALALAGCLSTAAFARYLLSRKPGMSP
jgi:multicomponent Na+:H+ antiporter subunit F